MAKQAGMGDNLYIDGVDLSGDTGSLNRIAGGPAALDVTGINKSAFERLGGIREGGIDWSSWWNPDGAHPALGALPTTDRIATYCRGTALGAPAASCVAKQVNYDPTRNADASLTAGVQAQSTGFGLEWGIQLTSGRDTLSGAGNGAPVDNGVGTAFGLQAYLHVFAFTGTSATVAIQGSSDNAVGDPYANIAGATFAAVTAPGAQRIQTARNEPVERWLRLAVTGAFTALDFAVVVVRNEVAVTF